MNASPARILIIRLSAIGDVVRVIPAFQALRKGFPDAVIDWAVEAKSAGVVQGLPGLNAAHVFERGGGLTRTVASFMGLCRLLRRNRYDLVLDFHGILKSGLLGRCAGAPRRRGFAPPRSQEASSLFLTERVVLDNDRLNRVEENLRLCDELVARPERCGLHLYVPPDIEEEVDGFFDATFQGGKRVVALHAPSERPEKQWPLTHFAELSDRLLADGRFEGLLTCGPGQEDIVESVQQLARRNPTVAPGTPDLKHYARLVQRAHLYVGGDTGPMHIAWMMGTPVVAIFGGTDPAKHAPFDAPHTILFDSAGENEPDFRDKRQGQARMQRITAEAAYDACVALALKERE